MVDEKDCYVVLKSILDGKDKVLAKCRYEAQYWQDYSKGLEAEIKGLIETIGDLTHHISNGRHRERALENKIENPDKDLEQANNEIEYLKWVIDCREKSIARRKSRSEALVADIIKLKEEIKRYQAIELVTWARA